MARPSRRGFYNSDLMEITKIKAGRRCERCRHHHDPPAGYTLTTHHLNLDAWNDADWNRAALCQRCHLHFEGTNPFTRFTAENQDYTLAHCETWMIPHFKGWFQHLASRKELQHA